MQLNLKKPLVFFDLETTGINIIKDRIVEISYLKVMPDGQEDSRTWRLNPQMPIPAQATAIHGISDADVKDCPTFNEMAHTFAEQIEGCDLAGFNSNRFDVPLLAEEFLRAGVDIDLGKRRFIDVQTIFHKKESRNLIAAYKFYCGKDLSDAHQAESDTRATYEVLMSQLDKYPELENDVEALSEFSSVAHNVDFAYRLVYNENGEEVINFGKYKDQLATEVLKRDPGYYSWIMQGEFSLDTKKKFTDIVNRMAQGMQNRASDVRMAHRLQNRASDFRNDARNTKPRERRY